MAQTLSEAFDPVKLRELSDQVLKVLTSPKFLEQMKAVLDTPVDKRLMEASKRLTLKALRDAGIDIPHNIRLSSRYFDDQASTEVELADTQAGASIVNALNESRPGLLDELKVQKPALFQRIVQQDLQRVGAPGPCICGGAGTACIGGGT